MNSKWTIALCVAAALTTAACASKPAIPDEQQERAYDSTANGTSEGEAQMTPVQNEAPTEAPRATGPVATVDGTDVPAADFNLEIERIVASGMPAQLLHQFRDQIIDKLIDRALIENAIAKANIAVAATEVDAKMEEVRAEFAKASAAMGENATLESVTAKLGITTEELRESIEQSIAIEKILATRGFEEPDDAKTRKFYDDNKARFERPEQVHARHILISVENADDQAAWDAAQKRADLVYAEASKKGVDFATLAKEKSEGPSASEGGDLGFFGRGAMVPEFEEAAFALKKGEVSKPVKSPFGWHVIKLEERRDAGIVPYEEIAEQLKAQMKNEAVNEALTGYLDELRKAAKIERHADNVK